MTIKSLKEYEQLSPFEVKNKLFQLARKHADEMVLNAGRGNPDWIFATPHQAFFTLGQFAIEESKRRFDYPHTGTHASISYIKGTKEVLYARLRDLHQSLGLPIEYGPAATTYYVIIYILNVAQRRYGNEFAKHREELYTPLSFDFCAGGAKVSHCVARRWLRRTDLVSTSFSG